MNTVEMKSSIMEIDKVVKGYIKNNDWDSAIERLETVEQCIAEQSENLLPVVLELVQRFKNNILKVYAEDQERFLAACIIQVTFNDMRKSFNMYKCGEEVRAELGIDGGANLLMYLWKDLLHKIVFFYC